MYARVVVDRTLRRIGGGETGTLGPSLRLDGFEDDAILRRRLRSFEGKSTARVVLWKDQK